MFVSSVCWFLIYSALISPPLSIFGHSSAIQIDRILSFVRNCPDDFRRFGNGGRETNRMKWLTIHVIKILFKVETKEALLMRSELLPGFLRVRWILSGDSSTSLNETLPLALFNRFLDFLFSSFRFTFLFLFSFIYFFFFFLFCFVSIKSSTCTASIKPAKCLLN